MTFNNLCVELDKLGYRFNIKFMPLRVFIGIVPNGDGLSIYANHTLKIRGSRLRFWHLISNPHDLYKLVSEFCKGDTSMTKKKIDEQVAEDIQQLAKDLAKKKEIEKSTTITKKIAKELGVKLPKSKK